MRKARTVTISAEMHRVLKDLPISASSAVSQSIVNAFENDSFLLKALKRRLALPAPTMPEEEKIKTCFSQDVRLDQMINELSRKSQFSQEETVRLCVEAFVYKL